MALSDKNGHLEDMTEKYNSTLHTSVRHEKTICDHNDKITHQAQEIEKHQTLLHKLKEDHSGLKTKHASLDHENINLRVVEAKNKENELKIHGHLQDINSYKLQNRDHELTLSSK